MRSPCSPREEGDADLATLAAQLGRFLYFTGRTDEALERVDFALTLAEALRLPEVLSQALNTRGLILSTKGRYEEGTLLLRHALQVALENDLTAAALRAYNNLGAALSQQDQFAQLLGVTAEATEFARRVGDRRWETSFLTNDIEDLIYLGRWDEAESRAELANGRDDVLILQPLMALAPMRVDRGEVREARAVLELLPEAGTSSDVQLRSGYRGAESPVLRAEGRLSDALAAADEALASSRELGVRSSTAKRGMAEALESAYAFVISTRLEELCGRSNGSGRVSSPIHPGAGGPVRSTARRRPGPNGARRSRVQGGDPLVRGGADAVPAGRRAARPGGVADRARPRRGRRAAPRQSPRGVRPVARPAVGRIAWNVRSHPFRRSPSGRIWGRADDLRGLRDRERARAEVLRRVRGRGCFLVPVLRNGEPCRLQILRRVRSGHRRQDPPERRRRLPRRSSRGPHR